jgi:carboxyl-terminal processing protease
MLPRNFYTILIVSIISIPCYLKSDRLRQSEPIQDALYLIDNFYVTEVDRRDLVEAAMDGIVQKLDRNSEYVSQRDFEQLMRDLNQHFAGIGVSITGPPRDKKLRIITPMLNSPAELAGIKPGDLLLAIDGRSTEGIDVDEAGKRMRGPIGTLVKLSLGREGVDAPIEVQVPRADIQLDSVFGDHRDENRQWVFRLREYPDIGYIRIDQFGDRTVDEFSAALASVQKQSVTGLVIDLRDNPGGLLDAATEICDMFLHQGTIVSTAARRTEFEQEHLAKPGVELADAIPVVILVDRGSASASEIVAACLQDHRRAKIAGERSFGKGTVQQLIELEGGATALRLTIARYLRPSRQNIHRGEELKENDAWGVRPEPELTVSLTDPQRISIRRRWYRALYPLIPEKDIPGAVIEEEKEEKENDQKENEAKKDVGDQTQSQQGASEPATSAEDAAPIVVDGPLSDDPQLKAAVDAIRE